MKSRSEDTNTSRIIPLKGESAEPSAVRVNRPISSSSATKSLGCRSTSSTTYLRREVLHALLFSAMTLSCAPRPKYDQNKRTKQRPMSIHHMQVIQCTGKRLGFTAITARSLWPQRFGQARKPLSCLAVHPTGLKQMHWETGATCRACRWPRRPRPRPRPPTDSQGPNCTLGPGKIGQTLRSGRCSSQLWLQTFQQVSSRSNKRRRQTQPSPRDFSHRVIGLSLERLVLDRVGVEVIPTPEDPLLVHPVNLHRHQQTDDFCKGGKRRP